MHVPRGWAVKNETGLRKWALKHKPIQNCPSTARTSMLTVQNINFNPDAISGLGRCARGAVRMHVPWGWAVKNETRK